MNPSRIDLQKECELFQNLQVESSESTLSPQDSQIRKISSQLNFLQSTPERRHYPSPSGMSVATSPYGQAQLVTEDDLFADIDDVSPVLEGALAVSRVASPLTSSSPAPSKGPAFFASFAEDENLDEFRELEIGDRIQEKPSISPKSDLAKADLSDDD